MLDSPEELDLCWDDCRDDAHSTAPSGFVQAKHNLLVCERLRDQAYECGPDGHPRYVRELDECDWERWAIEDFEYPDDYVNYKTRSLTSCQTQCIQSFALGCERTGTEAWEDGCFQRCEDFVHYGVAYTCFQRLHDLQVCETAGWGNGNRYICAGGWPYLTYNACAYQRRLFDDCQAGRP